MYAQDYIHSRVTSSKHPYCWVYGTFLYRLDSSRTELKLSRRLVAHSSNPSTQEAGQEDPSRDQSGDYTVSSR